MHSSANITRSFKGNIWERRSETYTVLRTEFHLVPFTYGNFTAQRLGS